MNNDGISSVNLRVSVPLCETVQAVVTTYPLLSCGTNITHYVWGLDLSGTPQGAGGVGGLCAVFPDNGITPHYPAYDANGNVTEYVDFIGNTIAHYEYDAFGNAVNKSGSMADDFVFRFSTKYFDTETGLYYYGNIRYYSPPLGRWISRDPIEEEGGINLYGFCGNDPISKVDYLGMLPSITWGNQCGKADVTKAVPNVLNKVAQKFWKLSRCEKLEHCNALFGEDHGKAWDINRLSEIGEKDLALNYFPGIPRGSAGVERTVIFHGKCYYASAVNYAMWGKANQLCFSEFPDRVWHSFPLVTVISGGRKILLFGGALLGASTAFTAYGYYGVPPESVSSCSLDGYSTRGGVDVPPLIFTWLPRNLNPRASGGR